MERREAAPIKSITTGYQQKKAAKKQTGDDLSAFFSDIQKTVAKKTKKTIKKSVCVRKFVFLFFELLYFVCVNRAYC